MGKNEENKAVSEQIETFDDLAEFEDIQTEKNKADTQEVVGATEEESVEKITEEYDEPEKTGIKKYLTANYIFAVIMLLAIAFILFPKSAPKKPVTKSASFYDVSKPEKVADNLEEKINTPKPKLEAVESQGVQLDLGDEKTTLQSVEWTDVPNRGFENHELKEALSKIEDLEGKYNDAMKTISAQHKKIESMVTKKELASSLTKYAEKTTEYINSIKQEKNNDTSTITESDVLAIVNRQMAISAEFKAKRKQYTLVGAVENSEGDIIVTLEVKGSGGKQITLTKGEMVRGYGRVHYIDSMGCIKTKTGERIEIDGASCLKG